jgi:hypothetical protein
MTGKQQSDRKIAGPACKCKKNDLEQKINILTKHEGDHSLSSIASEFDWLLQQ